VDLAIKLKFDALIKAFKESNPDIAEFTLENIVLPEELLRSEEKDLSAFSKTEDRVCALGLFRYGYGYWDLIRNDIRNCRELAFNWIARSRTSVDIQKRCDQLIVQFKKEFIPESLSSQPSLKDLPKEPKAKEAKKKNPAKGKGKKEDDEDF
jgi:hypothetical protein